MNTMELEKDLTMEVRNEALIEYFGVAGINKCEQFSKVDGPDAENINAILKTAKANGQEQEFIQIFENAYNLLSGKESELEAFQNRVDEEIGDKLDRKNNYTVYKLLLEIAQDMISPECEITLITGFSEDTTSKKGFWNFREKNKNVHVLCFDKEGNIINRCRMDKPLKISFDSFVNMAENFNKQLENSIIYSSNDANSDNDSDFVIHYTNVKEESNEADSSDNMHQKSTSNPKILKKIGNILAVNSDGTSTVNTKALIGVVGALAATTCLVSGVSAGKDKRISDLEYCVPYVEALKGRSGGNEVLDELVNIKQNLEVLGLTYNPETKTLSPAKGAKPISGTQSANASKN